MVGTDLLSGDSQPHLHATLLQHACSVYLGFLGKRIQHTMSMVDQKDLSFAQIQILVQIFKHPLSHVPERTGHF